MEEEDPEVADPGLDAPPLELELDPLVPLELLPLGLVPPEELLPPGVVAPPVLLLPDELRERIAKSTFPDDGLMITSLMVPSSLPELLVT